MTSDDSVNGVATDRTQFRGDKKIRIYLGYTGIILADSVMLINRCTLLLLSRLSKERVLAALLLAALLFAARVNNISADNPFP